MIHRLELENYRGFQHYKLSDLARVNLLVGKNNSGKTSILEALLLLASGGDVRALVEIAKQRGDLTYEAEESQTLRIACLDFSRFFFGHTFSLGSKFSIHSDDLRSVVLQIDEEPIAQHLHSDDGMLFNSRHRVAIYADQPGQHNSVGFVGGSTEEGLVRIDGLLRSLRPSRETSVNGLARFITQESLDRDSMVELWNRIIIEGTEADVVKAMQILDPRVSSVAFLGGDRSYRLEPRNGILLGLEGDQRRYPLASHGEGMRRILGLALALATTKGGVLLVDEIDTGLHYSILEDVWRLIIETAKRLDIQVFATTHSSDCLRSLARLCTRRPDLAKEISVQKIERELDEAVAFNAEQIQIAVEQEIEVR